MIMISATLRADFMVGQFTGAGFSHGRRPFNQAPRTVYASRLRVEAITHNR
jgi:hypothetical protein